ncbi:hypothetical protein ACFWMT_01075 [Streptomyces sp. NPDC058368]|uniref:hypothetical protein n=1 Tax=Streptomyces sp. NPDC058368 TaxID=3346461 RepID=UPI003669869C
MSGEGEVFRVAGCRAGQIVRRSDTPDQAFSRTREKATGGYDREGTQTVGTPGGDQGLSRRREVVDAYDGYDPEDVQFWARTDAGDVVMYLPEITYLDTQPWSVEIGLTPDRLVQLCDAIDRHLSGAVGHAGVGQQPTTVGQQPMVVAHQATTVNETGTVAQQATVAREVEQLRGIVARCQGLADWLTRHSSLGVDIEADSIRRAIGDRLRTALDPSAGPAEWEAQ